MAWLRVRTGHRWSAVSVCVAVAAAAVALQLAVCVEARLLSAHPPRPDTSPVDAGRAGAAWRDAERLATSHSSALLQHAVPSPAAARVAGVRELDDAVLTDDASAQGPQEGEATQGDGVLLTASEWFLVVVTGMILLALVGCLCYLCCFHSHDDAKVQVAPYDGVMPHPVHMYPPHMYPPHQAFGSPTQQQQQTTTTPGDQVRGPNQKQKQLPNERFAAQRQPHISPARGGPGPNTFRDQSSMATPSNVHHDAAPRWSAASGSVARDDVGVTGAPPQPNALLLQRPAPGSVGGPPAPLLTDPSARNVALPPLTGRGPTPTTVPGVQPSTSQDNGMDDPVARAALMAGDDDGDW